MVRAGKQRFRFTSVPSGEPGGGRPPFFTAALMPIILLASANSCTQPLSVERERALEHWVQVRNDVLERLAVDAYDAGAMDAAGRKLAEILENDPRNKSAKLLLAHVYLETNDLPAAAALLEQLDSGGTADPQVHYLRGVLEEMGQEYAAAAHHYARAVRQRPGHFPYVAATVEALLAAGEIEGAGAFLETIDAGHRPSSQWACLQAEVAFVDHRYVDAARLYNRALEISRASAPGGDFWIARQLTGTYRLLGRFTDAVRILESLRSSPEVEDLAGINAELVSCFLALRQTEAAAEVISQMDTNGVETSSLWVLLARRHIDANRWREAKETTSRALKADPSNADALMLSTLISVRTGDVEAAEKTLARWRVAHPDDPMIQTMRSGLGDPHHTYR